MHIHRAQVVTDEHPRIHPNNPQFAEYWGREKRRIIEGYWVDGTWLPGLLYFYLNYWNIELKINVNDKDTVTARPFYRDLEWEKAYLFSEARGFSGFSEDNEVTCWRPLKNYDPEIHGYVKIPKSCYRSDGKLKEYQDARHYMKSRFNRNMGKPLYENTAKNVVDIEGRGTGKSYFASAMIAYVFLFDGATDYDLYLAQRKKGEAIKSQTLVGAIDSQYSDDLIKKVEFGLNELPGAQEVGGVQHPSPFARIISGSFSKKITAEVRQKVKGGWKSTKSSTIVHRTFSKNHLAGNGTRPHLVVLEEVGFMHNLVEALGALKNSTSLNQIKMGVIWMMGTGGDMEGGSTEAVKQVFENPDEYDCLVFRDEYENTSNYIGYFVPPYRADIEFLDRETGAVDEKAAMQKLLAIREEKKNGKDIRSYNFFVENNPLFPSEAFLTTNSNKFPVKDIKDHINWLKGQTDGMYKGEIGRMGIIDGAVSFILDNEIGPNPYPIRKGDMKKLNLAGAVQVWERPDAEAGYGWYASGLDPFADEEASATESLGSILIIRRPTLSRPYPMLCAEYTARPEQEEEFFETARRLIMWYNNHECLYENNFNQFKKFMEQNWSLHLLATTPTIIKSVVRANANSKGFPMRNQFIKEDAENMLKSRLISKVEGTDKKWFHFIYSIPVLEELASYNKAGNFDRVIALMLAVIQEAQLFKTNTNTVIKPMEDTFFKKRIFTTKRDRRTNYAKELMNHYSNLHRIDDDN